MTVGETGDTRLSRVKVAARALLRSQRAGDFATVLSLVDPAKPFTAKPIPGRASPAEIQTLLDRVTPREAALHLPAALARAMVALAATPRMSAEIFLFSD